MRARFVAWMVGTVLLSLGMLLGALPGAVAIAHAEVYQTRDGFIESAGGHPGARPRALFLTRELQAAVRTVLGHPYKSLRVRYWPLTQGRAWILEDIGKEEDITIGFVVRSGEIASSDVLEFRETRGWEIRFPAFTRQFDGARLTPDGQLDRPIDGITGATLSVSTYHRLARMALLLDQHVGAAAHQSPR